MFLFSNIVILIFLLFRSFSEVSSICQIQISDVNSPIILKKFGSKTIILDEDTILSLDDGTSVEAYCGTGFRAFRTEEERPSHKIYPTDKFPYSDVSKLGFNCILGNVIIGIGSQVVNLKPVDNYNYDYDRNYIPTRRQTLLPSSEFLQCTGSAFSLFESLDKLPNCEHLSYALAANLSTAVIVAGLCFDLEKLQLKYVNYKTQKIRRILEEAEQVYPVGLNNNSLDESLQSINHFKFLDSDVINSIIAENSKTNVWLRIANFELGSIVQTVNHQKKYFEEHKNLFNIIWWHNLRIGNWYRFMELLEERSQNVNYNLYLGTSGELRVPMAASNCVTKSKDKLIFPGFQTAIPKFIWTLLNSTDVYHPESVVVIGYNSPYYEYFEKNSNFLCKDICDEIEWLQPMKDTRLISTMGIINCCRSEDVIGLLDGFPIAASHSPVTYNIATTPSL